MAFIEYPKIIKHAGKKCLVVDEIQEAEVLAEWGVNQEEMVVAADPYRDQLLARAAKVHLDVDPRWTDKRLATAVEKAESAPK